jgi:3-phosphoglycerate kinase
MKTITKQLVENKKVLVRLDLDVPLDERGTVTDTTRLESALPTLNLLKDSAKQVIIVGHCGRPEGKVVATLSLKPIANVLEKLLNAEITVISNVHPSPLPNNKIIMLENLRFDPREETNDTELARELAKLADIFVFDAFSVAHRKAASTVAITEYLPSYAGLRITEEIAQLSAVLNNPSHPFLVILGGAKIETKLPMIKKMESIADNIFVGGKLPKEIHEQNITFTPKKVHVAQMNETGLDISESAIQQAKELIQKAKLIVWNGPVGKFEDTSSQRGTKEIAEAVIASHAHTVTGGGDTVAALDLFKIKDKIDFVSVGGGAMLEFLSGKELPAITALEK